MGGKRGTVEARGKGNLKGLEEQAGHLPLTTSAHPRPRHYSALFPLPISHLPTMSFQPFPCEPPTPSSLADARRSLDESNSSLANVDRKIEAAEAQLAQIVADSRCSINQLQRERAALEEKISRTLAYMSPIRRLPAELLRHIFMMNFDEYPCCAWILSSVCSQWRRLALSMPKLWSKVWYLSQSAFLHGFFSVGALWAELGHLQDISAHFPTESPCSIALSHASP